MRVLIADKFEEGPGRRLQSLGCEVLYQPDLKDEALVDAIRETGPDVLVVRGKRSRSDARCGRAQAGRARGRWL